MKFIKIIILFCFLQNVSSYAQNKINVTEFKLDNGLTVYLNEDHSKPEIFGVVAVRAGAKNDPDDATGMAHYMEHMLFKGTEDLGTLNWEKEKPWIDKTFELYDQLGKTKDEAERKKIQLQINEASLKANEYAIPNELSNLLLSTGGTKLNANTGADRTVYFNAFPSNQLERWIEIYSHRFISPVFRGFQSELEVVYEEKNLYSDMFQFSLIEEFNKSFFKKHPYGQQSVIGTIDHLKNPSLTNMYKFFKDHYVANNMALILSGDFDTDYVKVLIKEKFGRLKSGDVPKMKEFKEEPFKGRELVEKRLSPIPLIILGYRTPPNGSPDEPAMDVLFGVLSNQNQTGLLDKLALDDKLLAAMMIPMSNNDYGATMVFVIPKVFGQKMDAAENLVTAEIEKVAKGDFDDALVEAVKYQLYKNYQYKLESCEQKALLLTEMYAANMNVSELLDYPEKIKKITKQDVMKIASMYFGKDYLAFHSKMGFPKKEKIEKPGYKPVLSNIEAKSNYVKKIEKIPAKETTLKFVDFNSDIISSSICEGVQFHSVKNRLNDIFSLKIKFGVGEEKIPMLKYASDMMNMAGTKTKSVSDFKSEFAKIGCSYNFSSDESYLTLNIDGIEENLTSSIKLIGEFLKEPVLEKNKLNVLVNGERTNRRMERSEPDNIASALFAFVKNKNQSPYLNRLSMKDIIKLNADTLVKYFKSALLYECEIHFSGTTDAEIVKNTLKSFMNFDAAPKHSSSPEVLKNEAYNENSVFFVNNKKAVQSKIYLYENGPVFSPEMQPYMEAFNVYFGGGFSGLVLQEIREYRSLAYGAGAGFSTPVKIEGNTFFKGYVGTQADKTIEAMQVFNDLISKMPEKPERMEMIKQYLYLSSLTNRPSFRDLSETVIKWKNLGYSEDPLKKKSEVYKSLEFKDIVSFYNENLKNKPLVYAIVGNKKRINKKELEKFGRIIKIKEKSLFK